MKKHEPSADRLTPPSRGEAPAHGQAGPTSPVPQRRISLVRLLLLSSVLGLAALAGPVFGLSPQGLDVEIKGIAAPTAPYVIPGSDVLILSFRQEAPARSVVARFSHEGYARVHEFAKNEYGVFVLDYPVPEGRREFRYRIAVDGLWMSDPENPRVETDALGTEFSLFTLEREPPRTIVNPRREADGRLTFTFRGSPSRRVSIAGDWNGWDPFVDYLAESDPGVYRISLRMRPGRHYYYFVTDGRRVLDAYNPATGTDPDGAPVSSF